MFAKGMFSIDPNSTPEQLANRRALMAMLRPKYGSARYVGEGLGQLATGLVEGIQNRKMNAIESAGRAGATDMLSGMMGGAQSGPMSILGVNPGYGGSNADPLDPTNIAGDTMAALGKDAGTAGYRASIVGTESGGNWRAQNNETGAGGQAGHYGRVQFGRARLQEAMDAGVIPQGTTPEQFMASPALQIAAENWHFADLEQKLAPLVGTVVNGKPLDLGSLVAMGHLGGVAGAQRYAATGGQYNPSDAYGTSLSEYAATHSGKSGPAAGGLPQIPADQLLSAMSNPWLTPDQRATLAMLLENQVQAADPMRQIELEKAQLELDAMKSPQDQTPKAYAERIFMMQAAGIDPASPEGQRYVLTGQLPDDPGSEAPAAFTALDMQAQAAGLKPGTPEYQAFMRSGGGAGAPAAFVALDLQAKAAGFDPGTPEYQEFMATRGAGLSAEATTRGKAAAEAELSAPADIAAAETTLGYISSLRDHPGRKAGSGASSWIGGIPGTDAKEFQLEVERLKAGAFLTVIDQLKGLGALSNAEGQTATAAVAALDPTGTEEGFLKRLAEYEAIVNRGLERARGKAAQPDPAGGKKRLKWNPATEKFE